jgi:hypothetical protein
MGQLLKPLPAPIFNCMGETPIPAIKHCSIRSFRKDLERHG